MFQANICMESMVCYEISMLGYDISMLCYAMVYVVKDKHSATVTVRPRCKFLFYGLRKRILPLFQFMSVLFY